VCARLSGDSCRLQRQSRHHSSPQQLSGLTPNAKSSHTRAGQIGYPRSARKKHWKPSRNLEGPKNSGEKAGLGIVSTSSVFARLRGCPFA
jgi:hypothetical protein